MPSLAKRIANAAWVVMDKQTKKVVATAPNAKAARTKMHKKDNEYGSYRYRAMSKEEYERFLTRDGAD